MAKIITTDHAGVIRQLKRNRAVFEALFSGVSEAEYLWRPEPEKWCLLEIVCHLCDEEREDFRARVRHVLETPASPMPPIDPVGWVKSRRYLDQDFKKMAGQWLDERKSSVEWLESLKDPSWSNVYQHPKLGPLSAEFFLANWLAHDHLHFRQINRLKYAWLKESLTGLDLDYAGNW